LGQWWPIVGLLTGQLHGLEVTEYFKYDWIVMGVVQERFGHDDRQVLHVIEVKRRVLAWVLDGLGAERLVVSVQETVRSSAG
jgi:hypothetical protein